MYKFFLFVEQLYLAALLRRLIRLRFWTAWAFLRTFIFAVPLFFAYTGTAKVLTLKEGGKVLLVLVTAAL